MDEHTNGDYGDIEERLRDQRTRLAHRRLRKVVPRLMPPTGAQQHMEGGRGSTKDWRISGTLATGLELSRVAAHYDEQLERLGWTRRSVVEHDNVLAWSAWDLVDMYGAPWWGRLVVLRLVAVPRQAAGQDTPGAAEESVIFHLEIRLRWAGGKPDELL